MEQRIKSIWARIADADRAARVAGNRITLERACDRANLTMEEKTFALAYKRLENVTV